MENPRASKPRRLRVLVADSHPSGRSAMTCMLTTYEDIEVVGALGTGEEAVEWSKRLRPDVVLLDSSLSGMSGLAATRRICALEHAPGVVVFSMQSSLEGLARQAGARAFVLKGSPADVLLEAIHQAGGGLPHESLKAGA